MTEKEDHKLLKDFFAAYFHQDWLSEEATPMAVVATYVDDRTDPASLAKLSEAIRDYSERFASDTELEEDLFRRLGCFYLPSSDGLSAKNWLRAVAAVLLGSAATGR